MKTLIIKLGALGDVVRTTCILHALKGDIYWVTKENASPLLENIKRIKKVFVFERNLQKALSQKYDLVINLDEEAIACKLASGVKTKKLLGAYWDEGFKYTKSKWHDMSIISKYGLSKANELKQKNKKSCPELIYEVIGKKWDRQEPIFVLNKEEKKLTQDFIKGNDLQNKKIVGISTGSGGRWRGKQLSVKKTVEIIEKLSKKKRKLAFVIFGGKEECERNKEIVNVLTKKQINVIDAGCGNSLREFAAKLNACNVVLTSDSLAFHIAIALKKKVVVFVGPTSTAELELYKRGRKIIAKCPHFYRPNCGEVNCTDKIKTGEFIRALGLLL